MPRLRPTNVIIGRTWLDADQVRAGDALGLSTADRLKLRDVGQGEFYAFGPAFGQPGVLHFPLRQGPHHAPPTGPASSSHGAGTIRAIRGVLGKFADLPHEAEEEIRSLDEARRWIADMERQIKSVNGASGVQRIDQTTVNRAITAAVERERVEWLRKMEQGRERFRRLVAALASTGQSLAKVKNYLKRPSASGKLLEIPSVILVEALQAELATGEVTISVASFRCGD